MTTNLKPDLKLAGLSIFVFGRQNSDSSEDWDKNWLWSQIKVEAPGALVIVDKPSVHLFDFKNWLSEIESLRNGITEEAELKCMEPNLFIHLVLNKQGQIFMHLEVTPDRHNQKHSFKFQIDQTYLSILSNECNQILNRFLEKHD